MIDITAIPARVLTPSFPIVAVCTAVQNKSDARQLLFLLVGRDRACFTMLEGKNIFFRRSVLQYHRTLSAGACCVLSSSGESLFVLADTLSSLTLHRISALTQNVAPVELDSGTIFVGDAWDATPQIEHVVSVLDCGHANAVCTRRGEKGVAWAILFEREEACMIKVDSSLERLFPQRQATPGHFVGAVANGVSLISPTTGETLVRFKLPKGTARVEAVQGGGSDSDLYAVVGACGNILVYDQRRAEEPVWSNSLWALNNTYNDVHTDILMTYCGEDVWATHAAEQLHCLRCTTGSVVCRSFSLPDYYFSPRLVVAGLCFTDGVLYVVGNKGT